MRVGALSILGQLDVAQLGAPDRVLLVLDRQRVPRLEIVEILLHDHVASTRECGVGGVDGHGRIGCVRDRILRAVDESQ